MQKIVKQYQFNIILSIIKIVIIIITLVIISSFIPKSVVQECVTLKQVKADQVIVAVGVEPNTQLAEASDLEIDKEEGGFVVNAELEARTNLYSVSIKLDRINLVYQYKSILSISRVYVQCFTYIN